MINPKELLEKANKLFYKIISSDLKGENKFPLIIPGNKQITGSNYSDWKNDIVPLLKNSKASKAKGYTIDWKEKIIHGFKQQVPAKIYFDTMLDFLYFIGKEKEYQKILSFKKLILHNFPSLEQWVNDNPETLINNDAIWNDIIKVCAYFVSNKSPHPYYIRDLPIEVHSKFIEQNTSLLKKMLDILLTDRNLSSNDFSERYYLKKVSVYTQIRVLDDRLKTHLGYDECSLKLEDASWLTWIPENVFIIENQICFYTFPKFKNSVAIFGEGFKSRLSRHIPWLNKTRLHCWFDLDTAGFEMLNMIREHYPSATSFLMNKETYSNFHQFAVDNKGKNKILPLLTSEEQKLHQFLIDNNKRLEQERISQEYVKSHLRLLI